MSDHSSAYVFGRVFEMIDKELPEARKKAVAKKFWEMCGEFDFSDDELHCDAVLIRLGLAHKGIDPDYPEDGPAVLYHR